MIRDQLLVEAFHYKFRREIGERPGDFFNDDRVRRLRAALIFEEACEFVVACGYDPQRMLDSMHEIISANRGPASPVVTTGKANFPEAIDALADIAYVTLGAAVTYGVDLQSVFDEVHGANMQKVGGGERADGKITKPEGWKPPEIEEVLISQGWKP